MIARLRDNPWGIRLLALVGMVVHIPVFLWVTRQDTAWAYRLYWHALMTGAQD